MSFNATMVVATRLVSGLFDSLTALTRDNVADEFTCYRLQMYTYLTWHKNTKQAFCDFKPRRASS